MLEKKLQDIASVSFGVYLSTTVKGRIPYLQASDFDEDGQLRDGAPYTKVETEGVDEKFFVRPGDVLLAGKGARNQAIHYESQYPTALASSIFFIIRVDDICIKPEFLAVYLNHPGTQTQLKARVGSSITVPTINKKELLDLPVPLPSIPMQQKLIEVYQTWIEEKKLTQQLISNQEKIVHQLFTNAFTGKLVLHKNN